VSGEGWEVIRRQAEPLASVGTYKHAFSRIMALFFVGAGIADGTRSMGEEPAGKYG
jgi:hypothetical protein